MYSTYLYSLLFAGSLLGCKSTTDPGNCDYPAGRYINFTVLENCPGKMPADIPHFCFEIFFRDSAKMEFDNGFEKFTLPYKRTDKGCRFIIPSASAGGDMYFTWDSENAIQLVDTSWTKVKTISSFQKFESVDKKGWRFKHYLNDCALAGEYKLFTEGKQAEGKVSILTNGQMNGFKPFLGYSICYAGDCLEDTYPPANTIDFVDQLGRTTTFVFKVKDGKNAIELYSIGPPIPNEKGGRSIGPMVYELQLWD